MEEKQVENHESYGLVGIHRTSGGDGILFGSSIRHYNSIALEIKRAERVRDLNQDWYHGKESLIRIEMSPAQFADLITSMNQGDGVPCTLRRVHGKSVERCPETNERLRFEVEFREKIQQISQRMSELVEDAKEILNSKKPPRKADKEALVAGLNKLQQELMCNIPFVQSQFNEAMDKVVHEAKCEVEAHVTQKLQGMGLEQAQLQGLLQAHESPALPPPEEITDEQED